MLGLIVAAAAYQVIGRNDGHLVYALDDPYIHMAIAKSLALDGVWGVSRYFFSSSSSSPLWTLLLAGSYYLFGVNEIAPLLWNMIFAVACIFFIFYFLNRHISKWWLVLPILSLFIFVTPLPAMIFCGQEHLLHALLTMTFVVSAASILSDDNIAHQKMPLGKFIKILALAFLVSTVRYEGAFLVFIVALLFALRRRITKAILLVVAGALPISIMGLISMAHGWLFLPNSVLLKGRMPDFFSLSGLVKLIIRPLNLLVGQPALLIAVLAALGYYLIRHIRSKNPWGEMTIMAIIFLSVTWLHLSFAQVGWFFRYEAYLLALALLFLPLAWANHFIKDAPLSGIRLGPTGVIVVAVMGAVVLAPFIARGAISLGNIPRACSNIYNQQYQMGRFLARYYAGEAVVLNDIGATDFLVDIKPVDAWGLANMAIARAIKNHQDVRSVLEYEAQANNAILAIIYDNFSGADDRGGVPESWVKIGEWKTLNNLVCYSDVVSFYAIEPETAPQLKVELAEFSKSLPDEMTSKIEHNESEPPPQK